MDVCQNSFTAAKGMTVDYNPLIVENDTLTNCLNGTFFTYNGNEGLLQNDMGNGRVRSATLPAGYVPVGMKEYGGIIYIASYNPIRNESQMGCFPSPERNIASDSSLPDASILEDINFSDQEISGVPYFDATIGYNKTLQKLIIQSDTYLNPGDSFSVVIEDKGDLGRILNFKENNDLKGDLIIHLAIIDASNNITYIEDTLNKKTETNSWLTVVNNLPTTDNPSDLDEYRNTTSNYHIYNNPVSGKLAIIVELLKIENFDVSYLINMQEDSTYDINFTCENDLTKNIYPNSNVFLEGIQLIYKLATDPSSITNYFNCQTSIPNSEVRMGFQLKGFSNTDILNYNITPYDKWSYNNKLETIGEIDFSKVGNNSISMPIWKYYVNDNSVEIYWGISSYFENKYKVTNVQFEFLDYSIPGTLVYTKKYTCEKRTNYNGQFVDKINFKQDLGKEPDNDDPILTLSKNNFYAIKIHIEVTNLDSNIVDLDKSTSFLKLLYTTKVFNAEFEKVISVDDFTTIQIKNTILTELEQTETDFIQNISEHNNINTQIAVNSSEIIFGDALYNPLDLTKSRYKTAVFSDFQTTSSHKIKETIQNAELFPYIINEAAISYSQLNTDQGKLLKTNFTNIDLKTNIPIPTIGTEYTDFLKLKSYDESGNYTNTPIYDNTYKPDENGEESFSYISLNNIDNQLQSDKTILFKTQGRLTRKLYSNVEKIAYEHDGEILECFYKPEIMYDGNNNGFKIRTKKGAQRFGFDILDSGWTPGPYDANGIILTAGAGKNDNDNYSFIKFEESEESATWKDLEQSAFNSYIETQFKNNVSKNLGQSPIITLVTSLPETRGGYSPMQMYNEDDVRANYTKNNDWLYSNTSGGVLLNESKKHLIVTWKASDGNHLWLNFVGALDAGNIGTDEQGFKTRYNKLVMDPEPRVTIPIALQLICSKLFLVQIRTGVEQITAPLKLVYHEKFNNNYKITLKLSKNIKDSLYKIGENPFDNIDESIQNKIQISFQGGIKNLCIFNNLPTRNISNNVFDGFENNKKEFLHSFLYGDFLDASESYNYFNNIKNDIKLKILKLIQRDTEGNLCNRQNVYIEHEGEYIRNGKNDEILRHYNFAYDLPIEAEPWYSLFNCGLNDGTYVGIDIVNRFITSIPINTTDDIFPLINSGINKFYSGNGWGGGWADTYRGFPHYDHGSAGHAPSMSIMKFFNILAPINPINI